MERAITHSFAWYGPLVPYAQVAAINSANLRDLWHNLTKVSAECLFLLAAVRRFLHPEAPLPDSEAIDWTALLALAQAHAVTPMLYSALHDAPVPDTAAAQLRSEFETSVVWSLAQSAELARLADLFHEHRIPVTALKGPLLSSYLYGDLATRSSGDIDLLAKRDDVLRIRDVLVGNGYQRTSTLHWSSDSAWLRSRDMEISFTSPSGVSIDLHWRLMPEYFAGVFDERTGWESLRTVDLAGRQVQTLAPEPLLLFLCAHGAKHMFERLGWICDIARFLAVTPDVDWIAIVAQARRTGGLRQLLLGVRLAADLLGAPAPAGLPPDPDAEALVGAVRHRLLSGATPPTPAIESTRYGLRLLETRAHRLRFLYGLYVTPSDAEYQALRLPPTLYFLYYPFRPMRLLWKHGKLATD